MTDPATSTVAPPTLAKQPSTIAASGLPDWEPIAGWQRVDLTKITDTRGNLTFIEGQRHVPFPIRRVYYIYDVPAGAERGGHAHRELNQLIVAAAGSFDLIVDDGSRRERLTLNRPYEGVLLGSMVWREMDNFCSGSVGLVLASIAYDEDDYIRDYDTFATTAAKASADASAATRPVTRKPR